MKTQEILSIVALALLGLCFLCGLAKMAMKKDSDKKNCDKACSMAIFAAVALVGVSQLLTETEKYTGGDSAFKPSPSDTRITLSKNSKPLYCANKGDCCEIQTAHPKNPSLNPYDVLVCKGGINYMVSSDDGELYTSPDKARTVFSCYDRVKFKEGEDKRRFSCVPASPAATLTAGKIKKVYCDADGQICDSEKPLADCLKVPGCYASYNKCVDNAYEYCQECEVCRNGQLLCGGC